MKVVAGIDIGGSHIGIGLMNPFNSEIVGNLLQIEANSLSTPEQLISLMSEAVKSLICGGDRILIGVGVGTPGQSKNGVLTAASNILPNHKDIRISELLGNALMVPVILMNDADAYLAAIVFSNKFKVEHGDVKSAVVITLGTGVGYSLAINGQLHEGFNGLLEGGHAIVCDKGGRKCGCGQLGCVETYSSAKNTALRFRELSPESVNTMGEIDAKYVFDQASKGNATAIQVLDETADYLALLCINICRFIDPEMIIFGGGMSSAGEDLLVLVRKHMKLRSWTILPTNVKLIISNLKPGEAGVIGAALAINQHLGVVKNETTNSCNETYKSEISNAWLGSAFLIGSLVGVLGATWMSRNFKK